MNRPAKHGYVILICLSVLSLTSFNMAQEQERDGFLTFTLKHHTTREVKDKITNVLENNVKKAEVISNKQGLQHRVGGYYTSDYELHCTNFYFLQKQMELLQWQYRTANDNDSRDAIIQKIASLYVSQVDTAKETVIKSEEHQRLGHITPFEYINCETLLDRVRLERLEFLSTYQMPNSLQDQILQLLESNVKKAERITRVFQTIDAHPHIPSLTLFANYYAEFYFYQKQLELLRWQYENSQDSATRQTIAETVSVIYEKQLGVTRKLNDLCEELFQQYGMTTEMLLSCKTLYEYVVSDDTDFKLAMQTKESEHNKTSATQMVDMPRSNVKKAQNFCEAYENQFQEETKSDTSPRKTNTLGLLRTQHYFHQKQKELLYRQYKNTKKTTERDDLAEKLMEVYKEQWGTAKKMADTAKEAHDTRTCSMKDYLDCENMFDQTTLDILCFMLDRVEQEK